MELSCFLELWNKKNLQKLTDKSHSDSSLSMVGGYDEF